MPGTYLFRIIDGFHKVIPRIVKDGADLRRKDPTPSLDNERNCVTDLQRRPITAFGQQRIQRIGKPDDLNITWNLIALQSVRIATAIPPFMVMAANFVEIDCFRRGMPPSIYIFHHISS